MTTSTIKALAFDVFGTVVDYRGTIIHEGNSSTERKDCMCIGLSLRMPGVLAIVPHWIESCSEHCPGQTLMPYIACL